MDIIMSILKIDFEDLRSGSHKVKGSLRAYQLNINNANDFAFSGPLVLSVRISTTDSLTYYVSGSVSFRISGECVRCLGEISHRQQTKISGVFAFPEAVARLDLSEQQREDEGIYRLESGQKAIDLTDLVRESLILDYPRYLKCSEDCKGLCPVCGCNLNEKDCGCLRQETDPRWAKLAELKRK